jgi:hypothetical protein
MAYKKRRDRQFSVKTESYSSRPSEKARSEKQVDILVEHHVKTFTWQKKRERSAAKYFLVKTKSQESRPRKRKSSDQHRRYTCICWIKSASQLQAANNQTVMDKPGEKYFRLLRLQYRRLQGLAIAHSRKLLATLGGSTSTRP